MLSKEQIETLKALGAALRPIDASARILDISKDDLELELTDSNSEAYKAYWGARELRITQLNNKILDEACNGSTPAMEKALEILKML